MRSADDDLALSCGSLLLRVRNVDLVIYRHLVRNGHRDRLSTLFRVLVLLLCSLFRSSLNVFLLVNGAVNDCSLPISYRLREYHLNVCFRIRQNEGRADLEVTSFSHLLRLARGIIPSQDLTVRFLTAS